MSDVSGERGTKKGVLYGKPERAATPRISCPGLCKLNIFYCIIRGILMGVSRNDNVGGGGNLRRIKNY